MILSDAVLVQVISTVGTIATVLITTSRVNRRVDRRHRETKKQIDDISQSLGVLRHPAPFADLSKGQFPQRRDKNKQ